MFRKTPIAGGVWTWSLFLSDFRTVLEVICQWNEQLCVFQCVFQCVRWCAVDLLWRWTEASLSLKGNCCLVRRRTRKERRQAGENQTTVKLQETEEKAKKKTKKANSRKKEGQKERKKKTESSSKATQVWRDAGWNQLRPDSRLEVSVSAAEGSEPKLQPQSHPWKPLWSFTSCDSKFQSDVREREHPWAASSEVYSRTLQQEERRELKERLSKGCSSTPKSLFHFSLCNF